MIYQKPISNIRMYPFINDTYSTQEYYMNLILQDIEIQILMENFEKYWGAATNDNVNKYIIASSRIGNNYNGYFFPSDMANTGLGGSGNEEDYYAKLDVTYDSNGKISNVKSIGIRFMGR